MIHLSDLHLGKRVNEFSMMEDQKYILAQIMSVIQSEKANGVILAGDIYDKAIPPTEAVQVFDDFLTALSAMKCPVFIVSGNHDSAERLSFGAQLMSGGGVYFSPVYDGMVRKIVLSDEYGEVAIHLLPFVKPAVVRHALSREAVCRSSREGTDQVCDEAENCSSQESEIRTYQDAVRAAVQRMNIDSGQRNVLVAHQFVTGARRCESEEVTVGGLDQVDASLFDGFDYVALGHIHSPQFVKRKEVRYCGTPLKYSFSEAEQEKSITVVELFEKEAQEPVVIRTIPLKPLRDLRKIRGTYLEVSARSFYEHTNQEDYLQITLTDEEDVPDGLQKLRVIYPNLMRLEYDNRRTRENRLAEAAQAVEQKSELELFGEFFELQNNQKMNNMQEHFMEKLVQELQEKN